MTDDRNRNHSRDRGVNEMQRTQGTQGNQRIQGNQGTHGIQGNQGTHGTRGLRAVLLVLAAVLISHGIWNGSMNDVLNKAVRICTECIGLG